MEYKYETDRFPVIKAKWFTDITDRRKVRVIVIHTMEAAKKNDTAEKVAKYFQNLPATKKASARTRFGTRSVLIREMSFANGLKQFSESRKSKLPMICMNS